MASRPSPAGSTPNRTIALGIEPYLDDFARANSAESWKQFAREHPTGWKATFLSLMNDPDVEVIFNLEGVNAWAGASRAANRKGGATDWELLQIQQTPSWWPRITWIKDDTSVPNPFA